MSRKNPLYSGEPDVWDNLSLSEQVEWIRKHLCTGPCGQSMQVMTQRERIDRTLEAVLSGNDKGVKSMSAHEANPADDAQPTQEEWAEYERITAIAKNELLTPDEAQAAYDAAPAVPLSDERIREIVTAAAATDSPGPQTHEEARQFHEGFLAGAISYAFAAGHSGLKSKNPKLREVLDSQGWLTIETFEKLPKPDWRLGLNCKPKYRTHPLFSCAHNCVVIGTRASSLYTDGLLLIAVDDGRQLLEAADDWMTDADAP